MMVSASPSPRSPELTEKTKRYDRQLRLWGDHGQKRLERSHICLINACATGTEMLKSLVLPGIGSFTIVDGFKVTQEDIGINFFLEDESIGKSRAECTTKYLLELNPDVNGEAIEEHPENLMKQNPMFFSRFSVVVGCQLDEQIQINEHTIVESHPDGTKEDLRLDSPFPELVSYMEGIEIDGVETAKKTPWLVLLYKAIQQYGLSCAKESNGNGMDTMECHPCHMRSRQKQEFKKFVKQYLNGIGLNDTDEEFEVVMKSINTALTASSVDAEIQAILEDPTTSKPENSKFWVMCRALKDFIAANNGQLPVRGSLPDMMADSDKYISLQTVYRDKAAKDAEDILSRSQQLLKQAEFQGLTIIEDDVKLFCKESHNLRLIRGCPIYEELNSIPTEILQELAQNSEDSEDLEMMYYLLFRGLLRFQGEYKRYPGLLDGDVEPDINRFKAVVTKLLNDWNACIIAKEDCIHELCRYGACELPSVAAFIGGCSAQEVIKIVTKQYIPLDNTLIYNAMHPLTTSFRISNFS